jgi:hypothetical protein
VGVIELRDDARFALEAFAKLCIGGELRRQDFDRDRTIPSRIKGFVDLAHSACAGERDDFVGT